MSVTSLGDTTVVAPFHPTNIQRHQASRHVWRPKTSHRFLALFLSYLCQKQFLSFTLLGQRFKVKGNQIFTAGFLSYYRPYGDNPEAALASRQSKCRSSLLSR